VTACLVIFQNHQYLANVEPLDRLYGGRFNTRRHVVPFYRGDRTDVLPAYENSFRFQGYFAQAARELLAIDCDHYIFIADDLILNPKISDETYRDFFRLERDGACFVPELIPFPSLDFRWDRADNALRWRLDEPGVEAAHQLPPVEEARKRFDALGVPHGSVSAAGVRRPLPRPPSTRRPFGLRRFAREAAEAGLANARLRAPDARSLPYPLVAGYSDVFVLSREAAPDFLHYCGVMSATDLHAEVAIPTAMVLTAPHLSVEADCPVRGRALWDDDVKMLDRYDRDLDQLLRDFPPEHLYLHPVKLSQWRSGDVR